jgi:hypothetical protein
MKKLVLLFAIFCMVSVSMTYASDIKKTEKKVIKIENTQLKAVRNVCVSVRNIYSPLKNTPQQCAHDSWRLVYSLVDEGENFDDAYVAGKMLYNKCISEE